MCEIQLTKDSDALICLIYKGYCEARESGMPKNRAKTFGNGRNIHEKFVPKWLYDDSLETCRELHRAGFLDCTYGDGEILISNISDLGIIYMEGRFSRNVQSIVEHVKTIKDLIPFI